MPERMRDFHEQKSLFKAMHIAYREDYPNNERIPPWTNGMIYVIDWFLWFMGSRGYTLQKNRSKLDFLDYPEYNGEVKLEKPFIPDAGLDKDREILFLKEHISDLSYCLKMAVELRDHSCKRCDSGQCHTQEKEDTLWGYSVPMALNLTKTTDESSYRMSDKYKDT